jgi:hypothetical protein
MQGGRADPRDVEHGSITRGSVHPFYLLKMLRIEALLPLLQSHRRWPAICATHTAHAQEEREETNEDEEPDGAARHGGLLDVSA